MPEHKHIIGNLSARLNLDSVTSINSKMLNNLTDTLAKLKDQSAKLNLPLGSTYGAFYNHHQQFELWIEEQKVNLIRWGLSAPEAQTLINLSFNFATTKLAPNKETMLDTLDRIKQRLARGDTYEEVLAYTQNLFES